MEADPPVPHVTHVNNILHPVFFNDEDYINNDQIYSSNGLYAHVSHFQQFQKGHV